VVEPLPEPKTQHCQKKKKNQKSKKDIFIKNVIWEKTQQFFSVRLALYHLFIYLNLLDQQEALSLTICKVT
jgi:hypothetical protein